MSSLDGPSSERWGDLRRNRTRVEGRYAAERLCVQGVPSNIFMAIGHDDALHVLIPFEGDPEDGPPVRLVGLQVVEKQIGLGADPARWYLDIASRPQHEAQFNGIAREIAEAVLVDHVEPRHAAQKVVQRWRAFWRVASPGGLSRQAQTGLFGEVWSLGHVLIPRCGVTAVFAWAGPRGERHDFQGRHAHLEIKVTERAEPIFRVSGLQQLELPDDGRLGVLAIMVDAEAGARDGLVQAIRHLEQLLANAPEALLAFGEALALAGYRPEHEEEYSRLHLRVLSAELYDVSGAFPRLTRRDFPAGLPMGITSIDYDIDLSNITPLDDGSRDELLAGLVP